jgi:hypothetical protein
MIAFFNEMWYGLDIGQKGLEGNKKVGVSECYDPHQPRDLFPWLQHTPSN